jgi:hypothetical protein
LGLISILSLNCLSDMVHSDCRLTIMLRLLAGYQVHAGCAGVLPILWSTNHHLVSDTMPAAFRQGMTPTGVLSFDHPVAEQQHS